MLRSIRLLLLLLLLANSCIAPTALRPSVTTPLATTAGVNRQVLGHLSRAAMTIARWDHYALVGFRFELAVLDLAEPTRTQWLISLPLPTNADYVSVVGRTGFTVVDLHEPRHPVVVRALPYLTEVAHYATADCIHQVVSTHGLIYVSQLLAGLTNLRCTAMLGAPKEAP